MPATLTRPLKTRLLSHFQDAVNRLERYCDNSIYAPFYQRVLDRILDIHPNLNPIAVLECRDSISKMGTSHDRTYITPVFYSVIPNTNCWSFLAHAGTAKIIGEYIGEEPPAHSDPSFPALLRDAFGEFKTLLDSASDRAALFNSHAYLLTPLLFRANLREADNWEPFLSTRTRKSPIKTLSSSSYSNLLVVLTQLHAMDMWKV